MKKTSALSMVLFAAMLHGALAWNNQVNMNGATVPGNIVVVARGALVKDSGISMAYMTNALATIDAARVAGDTNLTAAIAELVLEGAPNYSAVSNAAMGAVQPNTTPEFSALIITNGNKATKLGIGAIDGDFYLGTDFDIYFGTENGLPYAPFANNAPAPDYLLNVGGMDNRYPPISITGDVAQVQADIDATIVTNDFGDTIHVLAWGQSNMDGHGFVADRSYNDVPLDYITGVSNTYFRGHMNLTYITNGGVRAYADRLGPEVQFAKALQAATGKKVYVTKVSKGGTSITFWQRTSTAEAGTAPLNYWQTITNGVAGTMAEFADAGPVDVVIMAQGESDTSTTNKVNAYLALLNTMRTDLINAGTITDTTPWVIAGLMDYYGNLPPYTADSYLYGPEIEELHKQFIAGIGYGSWFSAKGVKNVSGHFTGDGLNDLGNRFAANVLLCQNPLPAGNASGERDIAVRSVQANEVSADKIKLNQAELHNQFQVRPISDDGLLVNLTFEGCAGSPATVPNEAGGAPATNNNATFSLDYESNDTYFDTASNATKYVTLRYDSFAGLETNDFTIVFKYRNTIASALSRILYIDDPTTSSDARYYFSMGGYGKPKLVVSAATAPDVNTAEFESGFDNWFNETSWLNQWVHCAYVFDRSEARAIAYFNGEMSTYISNTARDFSSSWGINTNSIMYVGSSGPNLNYGGQCDISSFALFGRMLTAAEIRSLYYGADIGTVKKSDIAASSGSDTSTNITSTIESSDFDGSFINKVHGFWNSATYDSSITGSGSSLVTQFDSMRIDNTSNTVGNAAIHKGIKGLAYTATRSVGDNGFTFGAGVSYVVTTPAAHSNYVVRAALCADSTDGGLPVNGIGLIISNGLAYATLGDASRNPGILGTGTAIGSDLYSRFIVDQTPTNTTWYYNGNEVFQTNVAAVSTLHPYVIVSSGHYATNSSLFRVYLGNYYLHIK